MKAFPTIESKADTNNDRFVITVKRSLRHGNYRYTTGSRVFWNMQEKASSIPSHIFSIKDVRNQIGALKLASDSVNQLDSMSDADIYETEEKKIGDLYYSLRHVFFFGKIIGLIPISGIFRNETKISKLYFRWISLGAIISAIVSMLLLLNVVFSVLDLLQQFASSGGGNASEMAQAAKNPLFYLMATTVYAFFLLRSQNLIQLFSIWRTVSKELDFKEKDHTLLRYANRTAVIILLSALVEKILQNLKFFPIYYSTKEENNFSDLEIYYWRSHRFWAMYISYHPILTAALFCCSHLAYLSLNFTDILIVLLSRALYFNFKGLVEQTEKYLVEKDRTITLLQKVKEIPTWAKVRQDHLILCNLLNELEEFLSPLIFFSYGINIYFICLKLHQGLTPSTNRNLLESLNSAWSFVHLIGRLLAISLTAARVNDYAHNISNCLQKCKTAEYCKELERLERMLASGPIGLSGLGCFVITRAFMLMVVSVIFTFEIVLLQASASSSPTPTTSTVTA